VQLDPRHAVAARTLGVVLAGAKRHAEARPWLAARSSSTRRTPSPRATCWRRTRPCATGTRWTPTWPPARAVAAGPAGRWSPGTCWPAGRWRRAAPGDRGGQCPALPGPRGDAAAPRWRARRPAAPRAPARRLFLQRLSPARHQRFDGGPVRAARSHAL
jgi:hypothetical protein